MQQEPMLEQGYIGRLIHLARPLTAADSFSQKYVTNVLSDKCYVP
jgi:hypothetical protein